MLETRNFVSSNRNTGCVCARAVFDGKRIGCLCLTVVKAFIAEGKGHEGGRVFYDAWRVRRLVWCAFSQVLGENRLWVIALRFYLVPTRLLLPIKSRCLVIITMLLFFQVPSLQWNWMAEQMICKLITPHLQLKEHIVTGCWGVLTLFCPYDFLELFLILLFALIV